MADSYSTSSGRRSWFWWIVGIILIAVVAIALVYTYRKENRLATTPAPSNVQNSTGQHYMLSQTKITPKSVPSNFPADLPLEDSKGMVLQNYSAALADGRQQSTRVFTSKATIDALFTTYQDYLRKNSWTVSTPIGAPGSKVLYGTKKDATIVITLDVYPKTKEQRVNITLSVPTASAVVK